MLKDNIDIRSFRYLSGPNLFAIKPVMVITLAIGDYEDAPSSSFPGFTERLSEWLPGLREHKCSVGRPGGFVERLKDGTYLPHITEHVAIELQNMIGLPVVFGRARGTGETGVYRVVIACDQGELARPVFDAALELVLAAMHDRPFNVAGRVKDLQSLADQYRIGPSTEAIVNAALARNIPVQRLTPTGSLIQLGWGIYQRRIQAAETSFTSSIAEGICQEKPLTNRLLKGVGLPVPEGYSVTTSREAWTAARRCGLPVVVKPADGNQGKGVSANLTTKAQIQAAFAQARKYSGRVLVERYIEGNDYRLLVVNGKMVAAARREAPLVIGDGRRTVRELAVTLNQEPERGDGHSSHLTQIPLDRVAELVLAQQDLGWDSVPKPGHTIRLRNNCNLSTGGTGIDVTDVVHPSNALLAETAARVVGLDVAGVDIVCKDIRHPVRKQEGAIIEVNASPGLRMHLHPSEGRPRAVGEAIIEMLYATGSPSRVPVIAVTGTNGKTTVVRLIAHMYGMAGKVVGMTSTEGTFVGGERIIEGDCSGPRSARSVLSHPSVEVAVLETARGGMLREGLAFDACSVAVVTNVDGDHLGLEGINTPEDMARVKQIIVESVPKEGTAVLNADDPLVANMARATAGRVIYFSRDNTSEVVAGHLEAGGRCVLVENEAIVLAAGKLRTELAPLSKLGFTYGGKVRFMLENALAATAAAWAAGLNTDAIARALSSYQNDPLCLPGRFNIVELGDLQVIVDYAHNEGALKALGQATEVLGSRRTIMVLGLPGDRRDADLVAAVCATTSYVDAYLVRDDDDRRGRAKREIFRLAKRCLGNRTPATYAGSENEAIYQALRAAQPGERVIILVDKVEDTLNVIETVRRSAGGPRTPIMIARAESRDARRRAVAVEFPGRRSRDAAPVGANRTASSKG